jgi:hypothetical protein
MELGSVIIVLFDPAQQPICRFVAVILGHVPRVAGETILPQHVITIPGEKKRPATTISLIGIVTQALNPDALHADVAQTLGQGVGQHRASGSSRGRECFRGTGLAAPAHAASCPVRSLGSPRPSCTSGCPVPAPVHRRHPALRRRSASPAGGRRCRSGTPARDGGANVG